MNFFTSDEHYNHSNIISMFVFRPFRDANHMNYEIIKRHNERVKDNDTVYHLGDFKFSADGMNSNEIMKQLNGRHVFIQGNHDKRNGTNTCLKYGIIELFNTKIALAHRPEDVLEMMRLTQIHIGFCGHVHEKWKFIKAAQGLLVNVGVDQWDYYPIDPKQIFKAIKREGL
jgi:calcineurin-like phosphoesterase family protein